MAICIKHSQEYKMGEWCVYCGTPSKPVDSDPSVKSERDKKQFPSKHPLHEPSPSYKQHKQKARCLDPEGHVFGHAAKCVKCGNAKAWTSLP